MQLVLEFCDRGDLRDALEAGAFRLHSRSPLDPAATTASIPHPVADADATGPIDYLSVLETAADIARGMAHLHACNIVHLDLKVWGGPGPDELQVYVCGGGGRAMHIGCRAMRARFNPIPFVARLFCMGLQLLPSHCPL